MSWFDCDFAGVPPQMALAEVSQSISPRQDYLMVTEHGNSGDRFLGIITLARLISGITQGLPTAGDILDNSAIALNQLPALQAIIAQPNWCAVQLQTFMAQHQVSHLPILNQAQQVIGVITPQNLTARMAEHIQINECVQEKQETQTRENYLFALSEIQSLLLETGSYRHKLQKFVNLLGKSSTASRAYIFNYHRDPAGQILASQLVEWCAEGAIPQTDNPDLQNLPMETVFPDVLYKHCQGRNVCGLIRELPQVEREALAEQDILSILILPIMVQGECWGSVGFDDCASERLWQDWEIAYLETATKSLASCIQKEQAEVFYESLFDHSTDAIFLVDAIDFTVTDANQRAVELFEADSVNDLIGRYGKSLHRYPESDAEFIANHQALAQNFVNNDYWYREIEYLTLKGNTFWGALAGKKVTVLGNDYLLVRVSDISDRKRSEQILKEQKEFLESIYEGAGKSIFIIDVTPDREFIIRDANPAFERITGLRRNYITNKQPREILPPDIAHAVTENYRRCIAQGRTITYEEYAPLHTGASWWVTTLTPLYDQHDRPYRIIGTSIEISDRKKTEQALKDSEILLKETEAISKVGGWFIDLQTKRAECTDEVKNILGLPKDLLRFSPLQNPQFYLSFFSEDDQRSLTYSYAKLLKKGIPLDLELPLIAIDGTSKWVKLSARPLYDAQQQQIIKISGSIVDITEKKQMELEIQASEARFRTLMENLNVGVVVHAPSGEIQLFNSKALELLGLTPEQLLGKTAFDSQWQTINSDGTPCPPDQHPISICLATHQAVRNVVMGIYRSDHSLAWILVNADPHFDDQRNLLDVVVCFTDITQERIKTEERIFTESRYRQIIQTQQEYVLVSLPDTTILFANQSLCQAFGFPLEEVKGKLWSDFVPPTQLEILHAKIGRLSPQNPTFENTNVNYLANGKIGWTQWLNQGFFDEMGNLKEIQSIGRDITALKQMEVELQNTASRYRSLIENSNDVVVTLNPAGIFTYVSPASFHILGYIPSEMEGCHILEFIHPDYHQLILHTITQAIASPFDTLPSVEFLVLHKNNQWRWFEASTTNLLTDEAVQGIVINCSDISDRKRLEQNLAQNLIHFHQLIDNVPAVVYRYTVRPDGSDLYEYLSENIAQMYALPRQAVLDDISLFWDMVHPSDRHSLRQAIAQSAETQTPLFTDYRLISADGKLKWIQEKSQPTYRDNGEVVWDGVMLEITELKHKEEILAHVAESCLAIIYVYDLQERCNIYANGEVSAVIGYSVSEIQALGDRLFTELVHPEDLPLIYRNVALLSASSDDSAIWETTYRMRHKNGSYRWLLSRDRIFSRDSQGRPKQTIGIATDITQLKITEMMLSESETHLRQIFNTIPVMVYRYTAVGDYGRFTYVSESVSDLYGITAEQFLADPQWFWDLIDPRHLKSVQETIAKAIATYTGWKQEYPIILSNGQKKWVRCESECLPQADGSYTWDGAQIDITQSVELTLVVQEKESRLRRIFNNIPIVVYSYYPDNSGGKFLYMSDNALDLFGISTSQIQENANHLWQIIDPLYLPEVQASVNHAHRSLLPWHYEFPIHLANGERKWIRGESQCILHDDGTYTWDGVMIDITSAKELEFSLRESELRLRQIFNNVPVAIYRLTRDMDHRFWFSYVSDNFAELMGIDLQDYRSPIPLEQVISAIDDAERSLFWQTILDSAQKLTRCSKEFRINGRWLSADAMPTLRSNGEIVWDGVLQDITDRKELINRLGEINTQLELVLESSQVGLYLIDLTTGISYVSPAYKAQLGYPPDSPHGVPAEWRDRLHPADKDQAIQAFQAFLSQTAPQYNIDFRLRHRDGSYRWIYSMAKLIKDESGKAIKIVGSHMDITQRKQIEVELQQSERRFRQVFIYSPLGMMVISANQIIQEVNNSFCEMLGYEPYELTGLSLWEIIYHEDVLPAQLRYARYSSLKQSDANSYTVVKRFLRKSGDIMWAQCSSVLIRNEAQEVISRVVLVEDMTVFREAQTVIESANLELEKMVKDRTDALESSQALLRQQLEKNELLFKITERIRSTVSLNDILRRTVEEVRSVLSADRVLIYHFLDPQQGGIVLSESCADGVSSLLYNPYPEEVFPSSCHEGFLKGKVAVTSDRAQSLTMSPCLKDFMASINVSASITAGIIQPDYLWGTLIVHSQTPRQWQKWEVELVQQLCTPLGVALLQSELYQKLANELAVRRSAEEKLQLSNAELRRANHLKDEFLANMSHELRTPLNSILGLTEGLLQQVYGSLNAKQSHYLATIERSGKHLLDLINDILDLAKIEAGKIELTLAPVNIMQMCEASMLLVRHQATQKQVQLHLTIAENLTTIMVDDRHFRQALINLLANAVKFTNSGGSVELQISAQDDRICFAVIDTGIGIAEADLPKLFTPFSQVDSNLNRRYTGSGLGLVLVKRITELHGGEVTVSSELNKGSCFSLLIPHRASDLPAREDTTAGEANSLTVDQSNALILIAEDNEDNIETIEDYLGLHGYRVAIARNGQSAVEAVVTLQPDLVLMDVQMPEVDGLTAMRQIRAMPQFADLPIIVLTALSMASDQQKAMSAGATLYLAKPYSLKHLIQKIEQLLQSRS